MDQQQRIKDDLFRRRNAAVHQLAIMDAAYWRGEFVTEKELEHIHTEIHRLQSEIDAIEHPSAAVFIGSDT